MIEKLYCVNLYTSKIDRMIQFYHDILEIPILFHGFNGTTDGTKIGYGVDKFQIALWDKEYWKKGFGGPVEIAIRGNIDAIYEAITKHKYPIEPIKDLGFGRILYILDPEGNRLAIMEED
ncbi:VOC family protein [Gorillibacterium massiliense]|uniref:VOC family protein n=1 Tax=Gorillibacterium massiliense TaxID=1280390 RepID=UPI0005934326|nr:VOC family protein [Gorillibacterium massiliense]